MNSEGFARGLLVMAVVLFVSIVVHNLPRLALLALGVWVAWMAGAATGALWAVPVLAWVGVMHWGTGGFKLPKGMV
jgi:hypothetical protein